MSAAIMAASMASASMAVASSNRGPSGPLTQADAQVLFWYLLAFVVCVIVTAVVVRDDALGKCAWGLLVGMSVAAVCGLTHFIVHIVHLAFF